MPGVIAAIQTFGDRINYGKEPREVEGMDYLEFIARVTSHIPDKGQVTVRYYGLYANPNFHRPPEDDLCRRQAPSS